MDGGATVSPGAVLSVFASDTGQEAGAALRVARGALGLVLPSFPSVQFGMTPAHPRRLPMERMEHIRGKILEGDQHVLDPGRWLSRLPRT